MIDSDTTDDHSLQTIYESFGGTCGVIPGRGICNMQHILDLTSKYDRNTWIASAKSQRVRATRVTRVTRSSHSSHSRPDLGLFLNSSHSSI